MAIKKVVLPGGKEDTAAGWGKPQRKRVLPEWVAYEVTKILEDNVLEGTGVGAQIGRPVAGKTGTTDNHADAWFAGYTPNLQTTVWVGYPRAQIPMENVHGISVAGGTFPADIWRRFMTVAAERLPYADWTQPNVGPVWTPFDTGQYAVEYVYSGSSGYSSGGGGTSSTPPPPPARKRPAPAPSKAPPATPPPVTAPPPAEPPPPPPPHPATTTLSTSAGKRR
jgi:penicillin-binding protein 1A